jgi:hypothetical protein
MTPKTHGTMLFFEFKKRKARVIAHFVISTTTTTKQQ